jgi:hypothetical protein
VPNYPPQAELTILETSPARSGGQHRAKFQSGSSSCTAWRMDQLAKRHSSKSRNDPDSVMEAKRRYGQNESRCCIELAQDSNAHTEATKSKPWQ